MQFENKSVPFPGGIDLHRYTVELGSGESVRIGIYIHKVYADLKFKFMDR